MVKFPEEDVVVMTNLGPAKYHNGYWFKWNLNLGRGQVVAHIPQEEFTSWEPLVVEPWMKTTRDPNYASPMTLCARAGIGLDGSPLGNHQQKKSIYRRLFSFLSKGVQCG